MRQMVARLISSWATSLTRRKASSSRLQRESGLWLSEVLLLARTMTPRRSSGGKLPGPAGSGGVLESGQSVLGEALAPLADGVAVAAQLGGDLLVGRLVVSCGEQDDAAAEGQGLGRGAGAGQRFELAAQLI